MNLFRILAITGQCCAAVAFFKNVANGGEVIDRAVAASPRWEIEKYDHLLWKAKFTDVGAITASGERIFVGGAEGYERVEPYRDRALVACLDEAGKIQWESFHERIGNRRFDIPTTPIRSKPCVDGDRVYYVSNRGELMCLGVAGKEPSKEEKPAPREPKILWRIDMPAELGVYRRQPGDIGNPCSSPIVIGELVFCVTGHGRPSFPALPARPQDFRAAADPPSFLAVNKLTGKIAWSSNAPNLNILYGQWSSPVEARVGEIDEVIFPGGDGFLYGYVAATGRLLWKLDCNEPGARDWFGDDWWKDRKGLKSSFFATATVRGNMLYVGLNKDFEQDAINPLLAIDLAAPDGVPVIKWRFNSPAYRCTYTAAAVADGIVYTIGWQADLFALDEATGRELWHASLDDGERNMYGNCVIHHGLVYASDDTNLVVFAAGPTKKAIGRFLLDNYIDITPEFVGRRMYVAGFDGLYAVELPKEILEAER